MISVGLLVASGVGPTQARIFADPLAAACALFDIDSPPRIAAFLGQCMVESLLFTRTEENLRYTTPSRILEIFPSHVTSLQQAATLAGKPEDLANCVYADTNGNHLPGDGWAYRGRGLIGLTGRANYEDAAIGVNRPYVDQPDLVATPSDACLTACWFWHNHKLNYLADTAQIDLITRAVNGRGMQGADLRRQYFEQALKAMS